MEMKNPLIFVSMKLLGSSILFLLVLSATFSNWIVIAQFNLNQKYIAEKLCVNRFKPRSCCKGKCFLAKQLNKEAKGDANMPANGKEKVEIQMFFEGNAEHQQIASLFLNKEYGFVSQFTPQTFCHSCFRPPQMIG
jgi:hypothetical protein